MKKNIILALAFLTPVISFAANSFDEGNLFTTYLTRVLSFINNTLVPLVFALAFLFFLWGIFKYFFFGAEDEGKREEGRNLMLWAVIAFVLMVSIWGVVNLVSQGLGFDTETLQNVPNVPQQNTQ